MRRLSLQAVHRLRRSIARLAVSAPNATGRLGSASERSTTIRSAQKRSDSNSPLTSRGTGSRSSAYKRRTSSTATRSYGHEKAIGTAQRYDVHSLPSKLRFHPVIFAVAGIISSVRGQCPTGSPY
ncbi:hypothetical protein H310_13378 [Aphanomyces invadans]|uniref:Uncharacterized protein n=1 Tax=Aphanomyces invadans TaxID=157072 RepID=A0A024TE82_9STRA|nr:hypothetical protein H310_13378 [Aphanomyces invadans]ETV92324.1 hypothetical protein H310_13378 [Aphanomyces invadans]|eukprot:XP_008879075.1 hypothetical protein H310_13378 [Aphanomyces invadans]